MWRRRGKWVFLICWGDGKSEGGVDVGMSWWLRQWLTLLSRKTFLVTLYKDHKEKRSEMEWLGVERFSIE